MTTLMKHAPLVTSLLATIALAACSTDNEHQSARDTTAPVAGTAWVVTDTLMESTFDAAGVAAPMQQVTVSTKLMGTVTAVRVREGEVVRAGQVLIEIDARDLTARASQVAASIADAEAMHKEATSNHARFAALYEDSAATRAQYDAAVTALARADAGVRASRATAIELEATRSYATIRAPFSGMVIRRLVDVGTFASPGTPLLAVQDASTLRLTATVPADIARTLRNGHRLSAHVDTDTATAIVEGVVPTTTGGLFTVNALVRNTANAYRAGGAAILHVPLGVRSGVVVPTEALVRDGDLVGVIVRERGIDSRRWVRLGTQTDTHAQIIAGLRVGETIVVPKSAFRLVPGGV